MTFVHRIRRFGLAAGLLLIALAAISPAIAASSAVSIAGKQFEPATVTVAKGDTVTWTVTTSIGEPHTVTSGKPADADKGALFDSQKTDSDLSKLKDDGGTYSFTFDTPGTYDYFCIVHPEMTGQVVVLEAGQSAPAGPAATGEPTTEAGEGVPTQNKVIAAAFLAISLVIFFGAAWLYRRMNPGP